MARAFKPKFEPERSTVASGFLPFFIAGSLLALLSACPLHADEMAKWAFEDVLTAVTDPSVSAAAFSVSSGSISFQVSTDGGGTEIGHCSTWNTGGFSASGKYYQFSFSPDFGYQVDLTSVTLRVGRSETGPTAITVQYSLDAFGTPGTPCLSGGTVSSENVDALDLQSIADGSLPSGDLTGTVTFRVWGHNASGTGNFRINDVIINGATTTTTLAAPAALAASATNETAFTAVWTTVAGATGYLLDVATNSLFNPPGPTNDMANSGFETGDFTGWDTVESEYAVSSDAPHTGTYCVKCIATDTRALDQQVTIPAGDGSTAYEISYWYKATGNCRIWAHWNPGYADGTGDDISPSSYNPAAGTWTQKVCTNTPAAGATSLDFEIRTYGGVTAYFDDFRLRRVGALDLGDYVADYNGRAVGNAVSASVTGLTSYATYYYRVRATNDAAVSANSNTQEVRTLYGFNVGDLMLTGYHSDTPDGWSFVTWVSIPAGVTVEVTDNGWSNNQFRAGEHVWNYTTTSALPIGAVIVCTGSVGEAGSLTGELPIEGISDDGDQLFLFNGSGSQPDFIFGLDFALSAGWDEYADSVGNSGLPAQLNLSSGNLAVAHSDNGQYTGARTGTAAELRAKVPDTSNWTFSNSSLTPNSTDFVILPQEPTTHASGVAFSSLQATRMGVAWIQGNGANRIAVAKHGSAVDWAPEDGVTYAASHDFLAATDMGGGNKIIYDGAGTGFTLTGLSAAQTYHVKIFEYNGGGGTQNYYANGTPASGSHATLPTDNDMDSTVAPPASQPNPGTISSLNDTQGGAVRVFDFSVADTGAADGLPTRIAQMKIQTASGNTADWTKTIAGVRISGDGGSTFATIGSPTIGASSIVIPVAAGDLDVPNGSSSTLSLYIWLKDSGLSDGKKLQFKVSPSSHGFTSDASGSWFAATVAGSTSEVVTVAVDADRLAFGSVLEQAMVNTNFIAHVAAVDENGNVDTNEGASVTIEIAAGAGTLTGGEAQALVSGSNAWSALRIDTTGTFSLKASAAGLSDGTSDLFAVYPRLAVGDISILAYRSDAPDGLAFVAWADIPGYTQIKFTDNGWSNAEFRAGEETAVWTAPPAGIVSGTVVVLSFPDGGGSVDAGSLTGSLNGLSASGDQIFAYQGADAEPSLIFGLDFSDSAGWDAEATDSASSGLPPALGVSGGNLAVAHADNGQYTGNRSGGAAELRAAVLVAANWNFDADGVALDSTDFVFGESGAPLVTIADPPATVWWAGNASSSYTVSGTASAGTVGLLAWTNSFNHTGSAGPAGLNWTLEVPLAVGTNPITITGTNALGASHSDSVTLRRMPHGGAGSIVISEILKHPAAAGDNTGEWVELYNRGDTAIDINGWLLVDPGPGPQTNRIENGGPLIVSSRGFVVVGMSTDRGENGDAQVDYDWGNNFDFQMANGADEVLLLDASSNEVARVEYDAGVSWPDPEGASMYLKDAALDMNDPASWAVATRRLPGFGGASGDLGSPGGPNETGLWLATTVFLFR